MRISNNRIPSKNTYPMELFKLKINSAFEHEETPSAYFKGSPANQKQKDTYRITKGVEGDQYSIMVRCDNLPEYIEPNDKVLFQGKYWKVKSIGYFYENNGIINAGLFSEEYIEQRSPKGITLG